MEPKIVFSELTKRWYVATRYKETSPGQFIASVKYDVTDQVEAIIEKHNAIAPTLQKTAEPCPNCEYPHLRPDLIK